MWKLIENLRQQSDHKKQQIALWVSITITLVITIVWFSTFTLDTKTVVANTSSPMDGIKETVSNLWAKASSFNLFNK